MKKDTKGAVHAAAMMLKSRECSVMATLKANHTDKQYGQIGNL